MRTLLRGVLGAVLCGVAPALAETPPDTIVIAKQIDDMVSVDPGEAYEISGAELIGNAYEGLVQYEAAAPTKLKPGLASSWQVDADGRTFTFVLRDAKFSTGKRITAADAVFSLQRAVKMDKSPAVTLTAIGLSKDNVEASVVALDEHALAIKLPKALAPSFVYFCLSSTTGSILDRETVLAHQNGGDLGNQWLATNWAGAGPYRLVTWRPNEYYSLEANPAYWGEQPKTKRVIVRDIKESATQRLMLEKADVDYARDLDKDQIEALAKNPEIKFDKGIKSSIAYLGLNQANPNLAKPEVVAALKYLIDYNAIAISILGGTAVAHQAFEPISLLGAIDDMPFGFDPPRAKALLTKAGLPDGFSVTMDVRNGSPWPEVAQALQANFAAGGVKLELIPGDGKQVLTKYRARHHDIFLGDWEPDYPDPHSNAEGFIVNPDNSDKSTMRTPAWRNGWLDPALNKEVDAALLERDDKKRAELYENMQREFQARAPLIMLFERVEVAAHRANVGGFFIGVTSQSDKYGGIVKK